MYSVRDDPPKHVCDELQIYDKFTQRLLYTRGITTQEQAETFFKKEWIHTEPYQYKSMQKAAKRLLSAIASGETIGIYSDYDCDGIPAAAALFSTLNAFDHRNVVYYVPDRNTEGFGLNQKGIQKITDRGASVVCILDCGTANPDKVADIERKGIDTIILDHHLANVLPDTFALINPAFEEGIKKPYPCAAGLVYLFIQALVQEAQNTALQKKPMVGWEKWQLDIIGLATLSDMVPLHGINRQIVHYGLQVFRKSPRPGIQALCAALRIDQQKATQDDLSFMIIPRINAASRMGRAETAFSLLTTDSVETAAALTEELTKLNNKRKTTVASMTRTARKNAETKDTKKQVWVFGNRAWKPSLAGLVAQKISETHKKSVFVWGQSETEEKGAVIKGSCRSAGHNLFELMQKLPDMFAEAGGHREAGGFTLNLGAEIALEEKLNEVAEEKEEGVAVEIDGEFSIHEIISIYALYEQFSPFGMGNESIRIAIPKCRIHRQFKFGKNKDHTRYTFADETGYIDGVAFFTKENNIVDEGYAGTMSAIIGQLEFDSYRNKPQVRVIAAFP